MFNKNLRGLGAGLIFLVLFFDGCATQRQHGLTVEKTSSYLGSFTRVESCEPTLSWNPSKDPPQGVTHDIAVFQALRVKPGVFTRGEKVLYVENITGNSFTIKPPLQPETQYFWSVRERLPDGRVSDWSTYEKNIFWGSGSTYAGNQWFGIKTPSSCTVATK